MYAPVCRIGLIDPSSGGLTLLLEEYPRSCPPQKGVKDTQIFVSLEF